MKENASLLSPLTFPRVASAGRCSSTRAPCSTSSCKSHSGKRQGEEANTVEAARRGTAQPLSPPLTAEAEVQRAPIRNSAQAGGGRERRDGRARGARDEERGREYKRLKHFLCCLTINAPRMPFFFFFFYIKRTCGAPPSAAAATVCHTATRAHRQSGCPGSLRTSLLFALFLLVAHRLNGNSPSSVARPHPQILSRTDSRPSVRGRAGCSGQVPRPPVPAPLTTLPSDASLAAGEKISDFLRSLRYFRVFIALWNVVVIIGMFM